VYFVFVFANACLNIYLTFTSEEKLFLDIVAKLAISIQRTQITTLNNKIVIQT